MLRWKTCCCRCKKKGKFDGRQLESNITGAFLKQIILFCVIMHDILSILDFITSVSMQGNNSCCYQFAFLQISSSLWLLSSNQDSFF